MKSHCKSLHLSILVVLCIFACYCFGQTNVNLHIQESNSDTELWRKEFNPENYKLYAKLYIGSGIFPPVQVISTASPGSPTIIAKSLENVAAYLDQQTCETMPPSFDDPNNSQFVAVSRDVRICWDVIEDGEFTRCELERFDFEITFEDENSKRPVFDRTEDSTIIKSDADAVSPIYEAFFSDGDYSKNEMSCKAMLSSEESDFFMCKTSEVEEGGSCPQDWPHKVQLFVVEGSLPNEDAVHDIDITVSDGNGTSILKLTVTVEAVFVSSTEQSTAEPTTETPQPTTSTIETTTTETPEPTTSTIETTTTETPEPTTSTIETTTTETPEPTTSTIETTTEATTKATTEQTTQPTEPASESTIALTTQPVAETTVPTTFVPITTLRPISGNDIICRSSDTYGRIWQALAGNRAKMECPNSESGNCFWTCNLAGVFDEATPDFSGCRTPWVSEVLEAIKSQPSFNAAAANDILIKVAQTIKQGLEQSITQDGKSDSELYGHEAIGILDSLSELLHKTEVHNVTEAVTLTQNAIGTSSDILKYSRVWEQLKQKEKDTGITKVLNLTEQSGGLIAFQVSQNGSCSGNCEQSVEVNSENIKTTSGYVKGRGLDYPKNSEQVVGKDTFFSLPASKTGDMVGFVASSISGGAFSSVLNSKLRGSSDDTRIVNGDILSLSTFLNASAAKSYRDFLKQTKLEEPIHLTFHHNQESWGDAPRKLNRKLHEGEKPRGVEGSGICAFWNPKTLLWDQEGCEMVSTSQFSTTCACSHLTSFSMLTNVHSYVGKSTALLVVTICGIAFLGFSTMFELFSSNDPNLIKSRATTMEKAALATAVIQSYAQFGLVFSYAVVFFLADRHFIYLSEGMCYNIGVLAHLLLLGFFSFLGIEIITVLRETQPGTTPPINGNAATGIGGKSFFQDVKAIFIDFIKTYPKICRLFIPVTFSVFIVLVTVIVDSGRRPNSRAYGGDFCWLNESYIWAFYVPFYGIVSSSLGFCIYFNCSLKPDSAHVDTIRNIIKQSQILFVIILLAWTIGLFQVGPYYTDSSFLSYAFIGLMAFQGFAMNQFTPGGHYTEGGLVQKLLGPLFGAGGGNQFLGNSVGMGMGAPGGFNPGSALFGGNAGGNLGMGLIPQQGVNGFMTPQGLGQFPQYQGLGGIGIPQTIPVNPSTLPIASLGSTSSLGNQIPVAVYPNLRGEDVSHA